MWVYMSIFGIATGLFRLFKISCLFIGQFENVMGCFTLKCKSHFPPMHPLYPFAYPSLGKTALHPRAAGTPVSVTFTKCPFKQCVCIKCCVVSPRVCVCVCVKCCVVSPACVCVCVC